MYSTSLWPCVSFVVDNKKLLGSAFGIIMSIQNIGMSLGPLLVTFLHDATKGYKHGFFAVNICNAI